MRLNPRSLRHIRPHPNLHIPHRFQILNPRLIRPSPLRHIRNRSPFIFKIMYKVTIISMSTSSSRMIILTSFRPKINRSRIWVHNNSRIIHRDSISHPHHHKLHHIRVHSRLIHWNRPRNHRHRYIRLPILAQSLRSNCKSIRRSRRRCLNISIRWNKHNISI